MMLDQPRRQTTMRGGLALIDIMCDERFGKRFVDCTDAQRRALLDEIAYTSNDDPAVTHGIAFFNSFRDLTATGFFTTKMGIQDLQYQGNRFVSEWTGCPDEALRKLGVG
jgi:gluconate 2-dehydrogenase subunit 3-like protein